MNILEQIQNNWQIISAVGGLIWWAIWIYYKVNDHEKRVLSLESDKTKTADAVASVEKLVAKIDTKLDILLPGYKAEK